MRRTMFCVFLASWVHFRQWPPVLTALMQYIRMRRLYALLSPTDKMSPHLRLLKHANKIVLYCLIALFELMSTSCYAGVISYLWSSTGYGNTGNIQYQGSIIDILSTKTNWHSGNMRVVYTGSCDGSAVGTHTYYRYDEKWLSVPSSISLNGTQLPVSITADNFSYLQRSGADVIYKQRTKNYSWYGTGACGHIGSSYPINDTISFTIVLSGLNVSDLKSGTYTGVIPVKYVRSEYFSNVSYAEITPFDDNLAIGYLATIVSIPYTITITNSCKFNATQIYFNHDSLPMSVAEGNTKNSSLNIMCDNAAAIKMNIASRTPSSTSYSDGVGIGLGNGWDTVLKFGNGLLTDTSLEATVLIPREGKSIPITSTLSKTAHSTSGPLDGSVVVRMEMR
ncbi:hypothetical protein AB4H02_004158 [Salmonella enterica]